MLIENGIMLVSKHIFWETGLPHHNKTWLSVNMSTMFDIYLQ